VIRLLVIVLGGSVTLQSSQRLDAPKLAYLAIASVAVISSCLSVWRMRDRPMLQAAVPWLMASGVLAALIAISLPISLAHGTPISQWLRDAATYGLFAAAPVVALDAAGSMRTRLLQGLTVATSALGALSFAIYWVTARDLAALPFGQLVLPTAGLPTALFVLSLGAAVVDRPRRMAWIVLGGVALGVFLITGSRSALLYVIALPVVIVVAGRQVLARSAVASVGIVLVAAALVVLLQAAVATTGGELPPPIDVGQATTTPQPTSQATDSTAPSPTESPAPTPPQPPPLNPDATLIARLHAFLTSPGQDPSIRERVAQYAAAWDVFASSPILGAGLGYPFEWTRVDGTVRRDFTADTPLVLPAKLGTLGILWLVGLLFAWVRFLRALKRIAGVTIPGLAMAGWLAILAAQVWGPSSLEDKGFSFAMMFLLSLAFIEIDRAVLVRPPAT
jgi:O-antigen ligase